MAVAQVKMAINSPIGIATLLEREEVMHSILKLIEEFNELSSSPSSLWLNSQLAVRTSLPGFHHRS